MPSPAALTYGPIFVGVVFNILLYGIMITQTFLYFTVYKKDRIWMKCFVALLFICDTLNCAFDITFLYIPLVNNFGNPSSLMYATWVFATDPVMTAVIGSLTQCFFAWRVNVLTHSIPAVIFIAFCALCQFCGGLGTSIAVGMIPEFVHFQKFEIIVIVWLAFSAVADCAITVALVWHLRKHKTGFAATDDIVNKIIRLTVQTGLITALCAVIDLVLFLATPSGLHLVFNLPLSKLYTNSLMSSLNSRAGWRYGSGSGETTTDEYTRNARDKHLNVRGDTSRRVSMMVGRSSCLGEEFLSRFSPPRHRVLVCTVGCRTLVAVAHALVLDRRRTLTRKREPFERTWSSRLEAMWLWSRHAYGDVSLGAQFRVSGPAGRAMVAPWWRLPRRASDGRLLAVCLTLTVTDVDGLQVTVPMRPCPLSASKRMSLLSATGRRPSVIAAPPVLSPSSRL